MSSDKHHIILMVEDNMDHAEFIRRALLDKDVDIIHQMDGEAALDYFKNGNRKPSFVLLDVKLPKKDGFEVLATLRAKDKFQDLPIIMLSTSISPQEIQRAYKLGANSFVTKPTNFEEFTKKIRMIRDFWLYVSEQPPNDESSAR